jgi:hypothetical protein
VLIQAAELLEILFSDNFDDGSLGTDWSTTYGGVGSHTCNSTPYSAYTYGYADSVTSRVIDLNGRNIVNVSYWLRRGSVNFSEYPDSG